MQTFLKSIFITLVCLGMFLPVASISEEPVNIVRSTKSAAEDPEFVKLLDEAKTAQKKADSVGGEWRDVGKSIEAAEKAAQDGDLEKAKKLLTQVKTHCEIGYEQAVSQKGNIQHPSFLQ